MNEIIYGGIINTAEDINNIGLKTRRLEERIKKAQTNLKKSLVCSGEAGNFESNINYIHRNIEARRGNMSKAAELICNVGGKLEQIHDVYLNADKSVYKNLGGIITSKSTSIFNSEQIKKDYIDNFTEFQEKDILLYGKQFGNTSEENKKIDVDVTLLEVGKRIEAGVSLLDLEAIAEGKYGNASAELKILAAEVHAQAKAGLYVEGKDGKLILNPKISAEVGASLVLLQAKAQAEFGFGDFFGATVFGGHVNGEITVGKVEAVAKASVGLFNEKGELDPNLKIKLSAEAIAAEAKGEVGVTVLGLDANVKGSVGVGVGAHADIGFENGKLKFDVGAYVGVGASISVELDFSDTIKAISKASESVISWAANTASNVGNAIGNAANAVGNTVSNVANSVAKIFKFW